MVLEGGKVLVASTEAADAGVRVGMRSGGVSYCPANSIEASFMLPTFSIVVLALITYSLEIYCE